MSNWREMKTRSLLALSPTCITHLGNLQDKTSPPLNFSFLYLSYSGKHWRCIYFSLLLIYKLILWAEYFLLNLEVFLPELQNSLWPKSDLGHVLGGLSAFWLTSDRSALLYESGPSRSPSQPTGFLGRKPFTGLIRLSTCPGDLNQDIPLKIMFPWKPGLC